MKTYSAAELAEILEKHSMWLANEDEGERADLSSADLSYADLRSANLSYADLRSANLSSADLRSADLSSADLSYADLRSANLSSADLSDADLRSANLSSADLRSANLRSANLSDADLRSANLRSANLSDANLSSANLRSANLSDANLSGAIGNMKELKTIRCDMWPVSYTASVIQIGCQRHDISEWWSFSDESISGMDHSALTWWRVWKPIIKAIIDASPAVDIKQPASEVTE